MIPSRQNTCSIVFFFAFVAITTLGVAIDNVPRLRCRCLPHQPCWPSESTWSALNDTVGGRLIATTPVARECHDPYYDKVKCEEIQKGYFDATWRQNQPGAVEMPNWETLKGMGCLGFNRSQPCHQGSVPLYSVKALTIADVQASVRFAMQHHLRLVIKNTGHCFLGRSTAANSLNLWTHFMNKIDVIDAFVPEGAPADTACIPAVSMEAGVLLGDLYKAVHKHGRVAVGGAYRSVGAIGAYCQGGGHSPISRYHGLCVDNVLQYKVVTADGELKVANAYQNQDLFWALRGGGPSTYGVVVEGVFRTHPAFRNLIHTDIIVTSDDESLIGSLVHRFIAENARLAVEGWSGYNAIERNLLSINYYRPNATLEQARASLGPFLDHLHSLPVNITKEVVESLSDYLTATPHFESQMSIGGAAILAGGRLIPQAMFETQEGVDLFTTTMRNIQDDLQPFNPKGTYIAMLVAGGEVSKGTSEETSVVPAWRKALMLVIPLAFWADNTPYEDQVRAQQTITKATGRLVKIIPDGGTYLNEADANEPNWKHSFFGDNYARLREIKDKYDPYGFFICKRCVGSEDWDEDLMCRSQSNASDSI